MDVTFRTTEGRFNYRVAAVITNNGRLLVMKDERSPYYYLPGGRVMLHETAEAAVIRELREETGADVRLERALWIAQSFFTEPVNGERYHEICFYFLLDAPELVRKGDAFETHEGRHHNMFSWLTFERVREEYIYPTFIRERIFSLPENTEIITETE